MWSMGQHQKTKYQNYCWSWRKEEKGHSLFKEIAGNFPNLRRDLDIQAFEANRPPHYFNQKDLLQIHYN